MATDNNIIYPTLVSMTSGLENNNKSKNILVYHLLLSNNFNLQNIDIFESLKTSYEVLIYYYIIPPIFNNLKRWNSDTDCIYYKLVIPLLFQNLKKIIFLDADTLIYKDLYEMYNTNLNNNYILGFPTWSPYILKQRIRIVNYINVGTIIINIDKIRKDKKDIELLMYTFENNHKFFFPEQDAMNLIFNPSVGILPLKYGVFLIVNIFCFEKFIKLLSI